VHSEAEADTEEESLESVGYVVTKIAPTSRAHIEAFLAGTLSDPEQPLLG
jgi:hypothetical protein